jgi:TRAP-type C4-dicarboxylate transport system substrate-binding protein
MRGLAVALLLACAVRTPAAEETVVKLATLAPQGSSWHVLLRELAERWAKDSGGRVKLRIYAGGTQGSEGDMVRKMAVGQLPAAALTNVGMHSIAEEPAVLTTPAILEGEGEMRAVLERVQGWLGAVLERQGYVSLGFMRVGAAYVFCTRLYRTPAEMADARFFVWEGDPDAAEAFRVMGLRPVVLSSTDLVPALQTGMINCVIQPPAYALAARVFDRTSHMIDLPWAWLLGGIVVRKAAWEALPAALRPQLLAAARETVARLDAESRRLQDDAMAAMQKQGLALVQVDPSIWRATAERSWAVVRAHPARREFLDEVLRIRAEIRSGSGR